MKDIHMGELLERAIRRKGLNITELACALNVTRRTVYNWFKQEVLDEHIMDKISNTISYDFSSGVNKPKIKAVTPDEPVVPKDEEYWKDRYIDLLECYSSLLANNKNGD